MSEKLAQLFQKEADTELTDLEKVAEDIYYQGRIFARGFQDEVEGVDKEAGAKAFIQGLGKKVDKGVKSVGSGAAKMVRKASGGKIKGGNLSTNKAKRLWGWGTVGAGGAAAAGAGAGINKARKS